MTLPVDPRECACPDETSGTNTAPDYHRYLETADFPATRAAACASRRERQRAARVRARRQRYAVLVGLLALVVAIAGWRAVSPRGIEALGDSSPPTTNPSVLQANANVSGEPQGPATPLFATYRSLQLHLPIREEDLTEVAFHQAAGFKALQMESLLPDADLSLVDNKRGTGRTPAEPDPDAGEPRILGGQVIRMWRSNRSGPPSTAADIGALPGAAVIAPVSGTVIEVKPYQLYGAHEDLEIHIQPTGWPEIDLVIIHVTDPTVKAGDLVVAGITRLASVRLLSDRVNHQLADYTPDPGDHVHMQLNRVEQPGATEPAEES